ncbi:aminopeptidase P family protein [Jannaschia sp. Os4]|uniref:aminopeptidase P family protein n=1 Tax=Jannaschia sp. Os4 TaxID=2807617 RepID=UPI001939545A|nr:aminopeptidase P family protein [Jannaschia sp. Os4]MBM2577477.1 aminopeptidase P family protein [Jannaschia sp. Os4]
MFQSFAVTARPADGPPRVAALRAWMAERDLSAFLVPRADAHQGETVPASDERLAWLTGFTGSAGFAVILPDRAAMFTDGRYTLQVRAQTDGDTFEYVDWPATKLADWLAEALPDGGRIGYDPWLHTIKEVRALSGLDLVPVENGVDAVWPDRPARPAAPVEAWPTDYAGKGDETKRAEIAEAVRAAGATACVLTLPESICWLLNVRGADLARTPAVLAFAILHADGRVDLFSDPEKFEGLDPDPAIALHRWDAFVPALAALDGPAMVDPAWAPQAVADALAAGGVERIDAPDPTALPKACKSEAEIAATREAHLRDAAAMVRFLRWYDEASDGITEIDAVRALEGFRRGTNALRDISFETIAGSGPHGALPHYRVDEESDRIVDPDSVMVLDSGGQYLDGTTDITRTIPRGDPPIGIREDFTRVLQGMIAVSRARFPRGVAGAHLDALARAPLWAAHKDYDHGTGHGVGVYLGVHEGPVRISRVSTLPLAEGMILSNEPGYYRAGEYGIRIENLIVVTRAERPEGGDDRDLLGFETLTWVPIDRRLIVARMLGPWERDWIDAYHAGVRARLSDRLTGEDRAWMERMTAPL